MDKHDATTQCPVCGQAEPDLPTRVLVVRRNMTPIVITAKAGRREICGRCTRRGADILGRRSKVGYGHPKACVVCAAPIYKTGKPNLQIAIPNNTNEHLVCATVNLSITDESGKKQQTCRPCYYWFVEGIHRISARRK